jgi:hypothetical protein
MTTLLLQTTTPQAASQPLAERAARDLGNVDLAALQARELDLREAVAKLKAQHTVLEAQTRSGEGYLRIPAQTQLMQVDLELAGKQAELSSVQDRIAAAGGRTTAPPGRTTTGQPPGQPRNFLDRIDPDAITAVFVLTTLAILVPLSVAITRRLWRRPPKEPSVPALEGIGMRLERLEHAVDAIAIEVERVSESQRFVAKVLVERPVQVPATHAVDPEAAPALGEAKPFLALGAGPIESIPVAQRQAVKQTVTPH